MTTEQEPIQRLRMWTPEDYPMLEAWWKGHGWPPVPLRILPPLGVIFDECAAGWAYMDNGGTGVAMMEWLVTDPKAGLKAAKGIKHVIEFLSSELKRMEYWAILTTCKQPALARLIEKSGFQRTDEGMVHFVKTR